MLWTKCLCTYWTYLSYFKNRDISRMMIRTNKYWNNFCRQQLSYFYDNTYGFRKNGKTLILYLWACITFSSELGAKGILDVPLVMVYLTIIPIFRAIPILVKLYFFLFIWIGLCLRRYIFRIYIRITYEYLIVFERDVEKYSFMGYWTLLKWQRKLSNHFIYQKLNWLRSILKEVKDYVLSVSFILEGDVNFRSTSPVSIVEISKNR